MSEANRTKFDAGYVAILLAASWLATISLLKLFSGNPGDLPPIVRERSPFSPETTLPIAITIELAIAFLALTRPRIGWIPLVAIYLVFELVLSTLIASGATSCGCGGGAIKIHPLVMASIDGALLAFVVLTRPWKRVGGPALHVGLLAAGLVVLAVAPALTIRGRQSDPTSASSFVMLEPNKWVGQLVFDVKDFQAHMQPADVEKLPTDGVIVLWRQGCEHCAKHLREMANDTALNDGSKQITLVQIKDDLKDGRAVDAMPQGPHVSMLEFKEGPTFVITTPWELSVEGGTITSALDEEQANAKKAAGK